jgi:integrase
MACPSTLAVVSGTGNLFLCGRSTIREWWKQICKSAGIHDVTIHGIRATFITRALDGGEPPVAVQKLVGHSSITTTLRYYRNTQQDLNTASRIRAAVGIASAAPKAVAVPAFVPAVGVVA